MAQELELAQQTLTELEHPIQPIRIGRGGEGAPCLVYTGDPNRMHVHFPEDDGTYNDVVLEAIKHGHDNFGALASAYIRQVLHRNVVGVTDEGKGGYMTFPAFKLPDKMVAQEDDQIWFPDGTPKPEVVDTALHGYLGVTIGQKGNTFMAMHGNINGEHGLAGGGMTYDDPPNEREVWLSKGIIAAETNGISNRGKGLGRVLLEGRVLNSILHNPDSHNINTGVNIPHEGVSERQLEAFLELIKGFDIRTNLLENEMVDRDTIIRKVQNRLEGLELAGYDPQDFELNRPVEEIVDEVFGDASHIDGWNAQTLRYRKNLIVEGLRAAGHELTAVEHTFLLLGGYHLNTIPDSARVRGDDQEMHSRRMLLRSEDYLRGLPGNAEQAIRNEIARLHNS